MASLMASLVASLSMVGLTFEHFSYKSIATCHVKQQEHGAEHIQNPGNAGCITGETPSSCPRKRSKQIQHTSASTPRHKQVGMTDV